MGRKPAKSRVPRLFTSLRLGGPLFLSMLLPLSLHAQVINFETLPDGTPTTDEQAISDEYAAYGVTFELLDPGTGEPIGLPRIAKADQPRTDRPPVFAHPLS